MTRARGRSRQGRGRGPRLRLVPSPARAGGLLGLLAGILALYGLTTASAFQIRRIDVSPLTWTDESVVLQTLGIGTGGNAFGLSTANLAERLLQLPAVASARVVVALPDEIRVQVTERVPILEWRVGSSTFVVDRDGAVFAFAPKTGARAADGSRLPIVLDARTASDTIVGIGSTIDPTDLDAATRLASLVPADVGSSANALTVRITDTDGWVVTTSPPSWTAVFGPYTPVLRTPDLIPAQVRLLRSLIQGREAAFARVVLADGDHGTYLPAPSGGH
jgi:cell division septal protein FtsQ